MTSRIPPSRRDPGPDGLYALHRAAKAVSQQTPGAGRVPGVAKAGVSEAVAAALRGKTAPPAPAASALVYVNTTAPSSPATGQLWDDLGSSCAAGAALTDDFNRADSTTTPGPGWSVMRLDNGATGHTLVNSPVAGVNTNMGYVVSFTTDSTAGQALQTVAYTDTHSPDVDITWTIGVSGQIGAMARVPASGLNAIWVDPSSGSISEPISGTSYGSYSPAGAGVIMRLVCGGTTCRLYRAGVNVVTFTHSGTGTRHGWGGITSGRVDDVTVSTIGHPLKMWDGATWQTVACLTPA